MSKYSFFSFRYLESDLYKRELCETGTYCGHINVNEISSFDEANGLVKMRDCKTWFILSDKDGERLSEIMAEVEK